MNSWICADCAHKKGWKMALNHVATFHNGTCNVCNESKAVTEPRDYAHGNERPVTLEQVFLYQALMGRGDD